MTREFYDPDYTNGPAYNTAVNAQVNSELVRPVYFVDINWDDGVSPYTRLCTHNEDITFVSTVYTGAGDCLSIGNIDEPYELRNAGINITLSGLNSSILTHALGTQYQDRVLTVRMGFMSTASGDQEKAKLIGTNVGGSGDALPPIIFVGRMDVMTITDTGQTCSISVNVENRLADFERTSESRYTYEDQIKRNAGDRSFEYVTVIQKRVLPWGE